MVTAFLSASSCVASFGTLYFHFRIVSAIFSLWLKAIKTLPFIFILIWQEHIACFPAIHHIAVGSKMRAQLSPGFCQLSQINFNKLCIYEFSSQPTRHSVCALINSLGHVLACQNVKVMLGFRPKSCGWTTREILGIKMHIMCTIYNVCSAY